MVFMGRGLTSRGQESRSERFVQLCAQKQASKHYMKSLVLIKEAASHKVEQGALLLAYGYFVHPLPFAWSLIEKIKNRKKIRCTAASWLCICHPEVGRLTFFETIYTAQMVLNASAIAFYCPLLFTHMYNIQMYLECTNSYTRRTPNQRNQPLHKLFI